MQGRLLYVELKSGYHDNGPAWIGMAEFSRSGRSIYFDGKILKRRQGISGNHVDLETGEEYWVSGVKRTGSNRHWAGRGPIFIDETAVPEYLKTVGRSTLPKGMFNVVRLVHSDIRKSALELENSSNHEEFDWSLRFKATNELTLEELRSVVAYYERLDMRTVHKKARKTFIEHMDELRAELEKRATI